MAKMVWLLVLMLSAALTSADNGGAWLFSSMNSATAPAPAADPCAEIIYDMMDCMDFLSLDQPTDNEPSASCCTGFNSVLAVSPLCVCEAVKTAGDIGLTLNMTRADQLPGLCGATTFDNSICGSNAAPGEAPSSPDSPPTTPSPPPPQKMAPAPATVSPSVSGAYSTSTVSTIFTGAVGVLVSVYFA
ncbi:hypothetical protein MLD38_001972 [Melastoma candidum]|uniref:Uncharacterized protein n=1 Tax=Melastoma candidum TaxID=119954 RepID=A0ACB9SEY6_9MYRT|nr:hypothetical protein MLD38_001972 [Melastoma candidum]